MMGSEHRFTCSLMDQFESFPVMVMTPPRVSQMLQILFEQLCSPKQVLSSLMLRWQWTPCFLFLMTSDFDWALAFWAVVHCLAFCLSTSPCHSWVKGFWVAGGSCQQGEWEQADGFPTFEHSRKGYSGWRHHQCPKYQGEADYIVLVCSIFTNDSCRFCFYNTSMLKGM